MFMVNIPAPWVAYGYPEFPLTPLMILVGGLEHEFYDSPYIGNFIIPTDFHIFQRCRYTTNQPLMIP
jgi:hypothetical protein